MSIPHSPPIIDGPHIHDFLGTPQGTLDWSLNHGVSLYINMFIYVLCISKVTILHHIAHIISYSFMMINSMIILFVPTVFTHPYTISWSKHVQTIYQVSAAVGCRGLLRRPEKSSSHPWLIHCIKLGWQPVERGYHGTTKISWDDWSIFDVGANVTKVVATKENNTALWFISAPGKLENDARWSNDTFWIGSSLCYALL